MGWVDNNNSTNTVKPNNRSQLVNTRTLNFIIINKLTNTKVAINQQIQIINHNSDLDCHKIQMFLKPILK
jgi:hypothetical protein